MATQPETEKGLRVINGDRTWRTWAERNPSRRPVLRTPTAWIHELDARGVRAARDVGSVSRQWQKIVSGVESFPFRIIGRRIQEAHEAGVSLERVLAWLDVLRVMAVRLYGAQPPRREVVVDLSRVRQALNDDRGAA